MATGWQENKDFYETNNEKLQKTSFFETFPVRGAHLRYMPNPEAMNDARRVWTKKTFTAANILCLAATAFVWAINFLFIYYFQTTLIPITGSFFVDSLILTVGIVVIWVIIRRRQEDYDNIAAEIESKYSDNQQ